MSYIASRLISKHRHYVNEYCIDGRAKLAPATNVQLWGEEVASLNTIFALANRQCNACSRSCSLPSELLSRVFEELTFISPIDADVEDPVLCRGWIAVIRVCQH